MSNVETTRTLRRDNRRWERDTAAGAASRRAMREDRRTRRRGRNTKPRGKPNIATLRRAELIRLYQSRWGAELPDDDSGLDDVRLFADHCGEFDFDILKKFCAQYAPWMTAEEIDRVFIQRRPHWSADDLAIALHLTDADRKALSIRTIGAVDYSKAARTKRRKRINRDQERQRRAAAGAKPHSRSLSALKPWKLENPPMSRTKWYRLSKHKAA
jgi:hypothetical protein